MLKPSAQPNGGYIALLSTIIMTVILTMLTFSVSTQCYYVRFGLLDHEYKRTSLALAESCVNSALLRIALDNSYAPPLGGETVLVGASACSVKTIQYAPDTTDIHRKIATVITQANYNGAWSDVRVTVSVQDPAFPPTNPSASTMQILSWEELATAPYP